MKTNSLKNKNFLLIVTGQIISLFGNGILRFVLPLYLLENTASSSIFGLVSGLSFLPLILVMPLGGIIADRMDKKKIMVTLDFLTAILMVSFIICFDKVDIIFLFIFTMMILYSINGLYQPVVQSSIPILIDNSRLLKANSIISSISALSNLLSPIIAGILFGKYGIRYIITISIICFFISAFLELFIKIPINNIEKEKVIKVLKEDLHISINFIYKQKPLLSKIIFVACTLNAFISSLIIIALPVLVTKRLNLSSNFYGFATGSLALGGIVGGLLSSVLNFKIEKLYKVFNLLILGLIPIFIAPFLIAFKMLSFNLILISSFIIMVVATIISILIMTYVQNNTPENIVGKIMAFLLTLSICSQPIGQFLYGFLFEYFKGYESLIILICIFVTIFLKYYTKKKITI